MLNGLHFEENIEEESNGLNKAVSPNEIYQNITDLIINTIKEVGYLPWQKEWKGTGLPTARNYVTGNPYTGINAMTLPYEEKEINGKLVIVEPKHKDIYYLTFNQIEKLGAKLKAGSKGRIVTYFNFVFNYENKEKGLKLTTSNASDIATFVKKNKLKQEEVEANLGRFPVLKYYRVFKATDCENLPAKEPKKVNATPNEIAEKIIDLYPNSPKIVIGKDERAYYSPSFDEVNMPKINAFSEESFYYSTFFHELIHSTGHPKRLDRNMSGFKGDSDYAFEELIAELGAVYLCAESGILFRTIENSAKYLKGWHKRLLGKLEEDNKFFFKAAASAQKGSNYILNLDEQGEPAYRKHFEKEEIKPASKVQKKTKKPVEKPTKETKKVVKPSIEPVAKVQKKTNKELKKNNIVGYLLLDSISGDIVATKKTLEELKQVFDKSDKNQKGNRVLVDWKKELKKPIEQPVKVDASGQTSLFGVSSDLETINFNKSLIKAIKKGIKPTDGFVLGFPKGILINYIDNFQISLSGKVLQKAIAGTKDHNLNFGNFIDLPDYLNNPVAIFKSKTVGYTILTEIRDINNKPVLVALHIDNNRKSSKIASMYVRENNNTYKNWINEGLHLYINEKSDLFPFAQATIAVGGNKSLDKFTNKNDSTKKNDKNGLSKPIQAPKKHAKISKIALAGNDQESEFYTVAGEVGKFLQQVERKPVESVVITMDGQQGAGKTTTLYKFMDSFAVTGNKCLFLSLEEHPASSLAKDKVLKYLSTEAQENIDTVGEVENIAELYEFVKDYEIIFIDSWQKLQRMVGAIRLDEDLRKKFNGKVFVVIFQQTTTGRTKGGAEVVFDGDIIIKMVKECSFSDNYAYFDKNRYTLIPIENIRYNIATGTTYNPNKTVNETVNIFEEIRDQNPEVQQVEFNFIVK